MRYEIKAKNWNIVFPESTYLELNKAIYGRRLMRFFKINEYENLYLFSSLKLNIFFQSCSVLFQWHVNPNLGGGVILPPTLVGFPLITQKR